MSAERKNSIASTALSSAIPAIKPIEMIGNYVEGVAITMVDEVTFVRENWWTGLSCTISSIVLTTKTVALSASICTAQVVGTVAGTVYNLL